MQTFYGTFLQKDMLKKNKFVKIEAETEWEAQMQMCRRFGQQWAFIYTEDKFRGQVQMFGLTEYKE